MKVDISILVQTAGNDANGAKKVFGIDQMSTTERKAALRKTTLVSFRGLSVTKAYEVYHIGHRYYHE